jgi:hypothetical protein
MKGMQRLRWRTTLTAWLVLLLTAPLITIPAAAQEEMSGEDQASREQKALDSTATQWSFDLGWQGMTWHNDTLDNGQVRPPGNDDFLQLRILAPLPFKKLTLLPRITVRHYENPQGQSGFGNTEIFGLLIPNSWDWGSGRFGIGPLVSVPGDETVARDEWGYGLASVALNTKGKWSYGVLLTQVWRAVNPEMLPAGTSDAQPLGIGPILDYLLGGGWYLSTGDLTAHWNWDESEFYMPISLRLGKIFVKERTSWNFYGEYQTSLFKSGWNGTAVKDSILFATAYSIPVG